MDSPFIHGRVALADAADLIERYGDDAGFEAAVRAERSRDDGNVARFCHWRQIERVIATLSNDEITGTFTLKVTHTDGSPDFIAPFPLTLTKQAQ